MARNSGCQRVACVWLVCVVFAVTSCQRRYESDTAPSNKPAPSAAKPAVTAPKPAATPAKPATSATKTAATPAKSAPKPPPIVYSPTNDEEIKEVFALAGKGEWEQAETRANALYVRDPQDPAVQRVREWVRKRREHSRERNLEDKIRAVDAKDSVFNPTPKSLLSEKKDRGLPPRKDVRDAVQKIEATPYIPESFGKTNIVTGPLFDFESRPGRMAKILDREISVRLDNATLESIIFNIGDKEGINFVADKSLPAFQTKLSVDMKRVKLSEFLKYVRRNLDLDFQVGDELVWIVNAKDTNKVMQETRFYRLRKGFILPAQMGPSDVVKTTTTQGPQNIPTVSEVQKLNKFVNDMTPTMPAIERAITNFFKGTYQIDLEHNTIVASGTREQLETLEEIIKNFDKSVQQVLIEARFVTVSQAAFLRLGVIWGSGNPSLVADVTGDQTGLSSWPTAPSFGHTWTNVFGVSDLSATLSALQQGGESQVLSAPRLVVVNNLPATINDGLVQYYYEQYQVKTTILETRSSQQLVPDGKPTKLIAGSSLEVLASVGNDGQTILLALNPKINSQVQMVSALTVTDVDSTGHPVSSVDLKLPQYRTEEIATRVAVRSGETVAMGGVLERTQTTYVESVPVLGNLPILGALFRRRTEIDSPRYLFIFVTATLLGENGEYIISREQGSTTVPPSSEDNPQTP